MNTMTDFTREYDLVIIVTRNVTRIIKNTELLQELEDSIDLVFLNAEEPISTPVGSFSMIKYDRDFPLPEDEMDEDADPVLKELVGTGSVVARGCPRDILRVVCSFENGRELTLDLIQSVQVCNWNEHTVFKMVIE